MDRQQKKTQFQEVAGKRKVLPLALGLLVLLIVGAGAWFLLKGRAGETALTAQNGQITIPLSEVNDGKAHFFNYRSGDTNIRFFVLKSADGVIRAALDTCDVCYKEKKGYRQSGDFMICNNCDQQFRSDMINEIKGGCNPAPLHRRMAGDQLVIAAADLDEGAWYFQ